MKRPRFPCRLVNVMHLHAMPLMHTVSGQVETAAYAKHMEAARAMQPRDLTLSVIAYWQVVVDTCSNHELAKLYHGPV